MNHQSTRLVFHQITLHRYFGECLGLFVCGGHLSLKQTRSTRTISEQTNKNKQIIFNNNNSAFRKKTCKLCMHVEGLLGKCAYQDWPGMPQQHGWWLKTFTCNNYSLIQVVVPGTSTWFSQCFLHFLLYLKQVSTYPTHLYSKLFLEFRRWFLISKKEFLIFWK